MSRRWGTRAAARCGAWLTARVLTVSRLALPWLVALGPSWTAAAAFARESTPTPSYDVAPGCDGRPAWLLQLRERLPPLLRTHPLVGTLSVQVAKIDEHGDEAYYLGALASTTDASLGARAVRGASCEEVLDALSFIAALGLERASSSNTAVVSAAAEPPSTEPRATASAAPANDTLGAAAAPLPDRVRLGAMGFTLLQSGLTPGKPVSFGVGLRLSWSTADWQPLLLLGAYSSLPEQHDLDGGGSVRFEHWSTHTVACPLRFPRGGAWGLRPCIELDVGRSSGEAFDVAGAEKQGAPWSSGGAQLRAELVLWERLELVASASAVAPFWYAHFFLVPDLVSFTTPALGFRAGSSASVLF